ncbi:MAG: hypothetical protein LBT00_06795 [Spirochaetaceae bacterium]|nr:hypothetical protein [Spirochaetaceae bacterium]
MTPRLHAPVIASREAAKQSRERTLAPEGGPDARSLHDAPKGSPRGVSQ